MFVYSRAGYGKSSTITLPRPLDYMQREATEVLPKLLDAIGFRRGILLGHSDGAIDRGAVRRQHQDHRVRGLVLMAPHFFMEPSSLAEIQKTRAPPTRRPTCARGSRGIMRTSMPRSAAGTSAWLDPQFREHFDITEALAYIRVPVLGCPGRG